MLHVLGSLRRGVVAPVLVATMAATLAVPSLARAQDLPAARPPMLITSLGQSLDGFQVQLATKRTGAELTYEPLAGVDLLEGAQTLFLAVGASLKGFGEAGISIAEERERARQLLAEAAARGVPVIVLPMSGAERRAGLTNQLIEVTPPHADAIFIPTAHPPDGTFKPLAQAGGIPPV